MATSGDGMAPYQGGGLGGKFRKRPIRRSAQGTPYDRPPTALRNNSPSLFAKLVDPASRLIYAGADRLFGVFRKRLPSIAARRPPETSEEPRNGLQEAGPNISTGVSEPSTDKGRNLSTISAAPQISELENMLKQKTFTRSEIERLTALLHSRTTESPSDDDEGDGSKRPSTTSQLLRLEASTSGPLNKHVEDRENFHASILTPRANSRAFEEDVASPAELAKAYMGTRPAKVSPLTLRLGSQAPRQESMSLNNTIVFPRTPITSLAPRTAGSSKGLENGLTTPRSRGRSAIYNMARTPYYRGTSTFNQKGMKSDYGHGVASPSLALSQPAMEHDGPSGSSKTALKRRSSVLDDIGSGGPVRRIRQKANLLLQGSSLAKHKSQFDSSALQQPGAASQKLILRNEPEPKVSKTVEENGETSKRILGYASVPTKSSQMASKILEQLERLSPKEKPSGSRLAGTNEKSPTKQTSNMIHGQALGSLEKVDSPKFLPSPPVNQKSESQNHTWLPEARASTSQSKDKVEENGPRKFAVPRNVLSSMNGSSTIVVRDNAPIATNTDSILKLPAEPPQKKRSFQMSAHEDSFEVDEDNHSNGHAFVPLGENKKLVTSVVAKKDVSADAPAQVNQTPALPEVTKTSGPEVGKIPAMPVLKKTDDAISPPKTDLGRPGGSVVNEQKMGFNFPTSPPSSSNTQSAVFSQSTSILDSAAAPKEPTVLPTFGTSTKNAENMPSFFFSADEPSGFKTNASPDAKPPGLTSLFNSVTKNDLVQVPASNKDDNGSSQKSVFMFGKSESLSSASPTTTSASGIFSFEGPAKNSSIANGTATSSPSIFASSSPFTASGTNTNKPFSSSSSHVLSLSSTTTTSASTIAFSTPQPAPKFGFGSATSTTSALAAPTKDKEPKSSISSSPFPSPSFATASTGNAFGFSSPAATATTDNHSQGSLFKGTSGSQTSTAVTKVAPFQFGSSSTSPASGTTAMPSSSSSSSGSSLFGSSAPAFSSAPSFGLSSAAAASASTEIKSGSSTSSSTNIFGSSFSSTPSFGPSSAVASSDTKFGSAWQPPKSSAFGSSFGSPSTGFSFGASSASSSPIVFGSTSNAGASTGSSMFSFTASGGTNSSFLAPSPGQSVFGSSTPVFGAATASPNNNDQMSMEDSMAEDSTTQTPTPSIPTFGQAPASTPGFMFGSATPTQSTVPFQFGGQTKQQLSQNPFQASGGQTDQQPSQNPFQASGSVEFNAGGSFSLGSGGGDKSGRRILRVKSKNRRK
ncbi:nuclear pore complex protein NUP1-like isoform X1 [Cynara cardunculus var. scolymus]|uniref:nuclear pore complex protein NUP1-like isoform X1 n=1 Tax=Cynara cardunculus var. scolymus TaxID=59895 RepID=UPI000D63004E|nr:nuclear pore complex protein NUP1-like isoform X1 [Cynara cardunculus var. scolymus]